MPRSWIGRGAASAERMRRQIEKAGFTPNGHPLWDRPETTSLVDGHPDYSVVIAHTSAHSSRRICEGWPVENHQTARTALD